MKKSIGYEDLLDMFEDLCNEEMEPVTVLGYEYEAGRALAFKEEASTYIDMLLVESEEPDWTEQQPEEV